MARRTIYHCRCCRSPLGVAASYAGGEWVSCPRCAVKNKVPHRGIGRAAYAAGMFVLLAACFMLGMIAGRASVVFLPPLAVVVGSVLAIRRGGNMGHGVLASFFIGLLQPLSSPYFALGRPGACRRRKPLQELSGGV